MDVACVLEDGERWVEVPRGTEAWRASMEWARFHGLDPNVIPAASVIVRDAPRRQIRFEEYVRDEEGRIVLRNDEPVLIGRVEQGEAPPLPFPPEVWS